MATRLFHMIAVTDAGAWIVRSDGYVAALSTALLPDVAFLAGVRARFAVLSRYTVLVNAVSAPIWFDTDATSHYLSIREPSAPPSAAAGAGTGLTGDYKAWVSFLVKDAVGNVLAESPLSSASAAVTLANQNLALTNIPVSAQAGITGRRVYRSSVDGDVAFHEVDIDDNSTTSISIGTPDAALSDIAAPTDTLGTAPSRLTNIAEWKSRLWAVSANLPDVLVASDLNQVCSWPLEFRIAPFGGDSYGITGFLPRRDELGICKRTMIWKVTGDSTTNFRVVRLVEAVGTIATDSCRVINDEGFFLGGPKGLVDGIYRWNASGVKCVSDTKVRSWFTSDTYFERTQFPNAVGAYHPGLHAYLLFLASPGSTVLDRWIAFDLETENFYGPHKTDAFSVSAAFEGFDSDGNGILMFGGTDGNVYRVNPGVYTDGTATPIDFDIYGKPHAGAPPAPDITKVWLQPSIFGKVETGGNLTITPRLGDGDDSLVNGTTQNHDLTAARERLARLGVGRICQLRLREQTNAQGVSIYGYELPYNNKGRR